MSTNNPHSIDSVTESTLVQRALQSRAGKAVAATGLAAALAAGSAGCGIARHSVLTPIDRNNVPGGNVSVLDPKVRDLNNSHRGTQLWAMYQSDITGNRDYLEAEWYMVMSQAGDALGFLFWAPLQATGDAGRSIGTAIAHVPSDVGDALAGKAMFYAFNHEGVRDVINADPLLQQKGVFGVRKGEWLKRGYELKLITGAAALSYFGIKLPIFGDDSRGGGVTVPELESGAHGTNTSYAPLKADPLKARSEQFKSYAHKARGAQAPTRNYAARRA